MDLMRHNLQVERVATGWIGILRLVAEDAHLHAVGVAAMKRQLIVAGVATRRLDDIAGDGDWSAVGNEIKGRAGVSCSQIV